MAVPPFLQKSKNFLKNIIHNHNFNPTGKYVKCFVRFLQKFSIFLPNSWLLLHKRSFFCLNSNALMGWLDKEMWRIWIRSGQVQMPAKIRSSSSSRRRHLTGAITGLRRDCIRGFAALSYWVRTVPGQRILRKGKLSSIPAITGAAGRKLRATTSKFSACRMTELSPKR